jgi:hypothetical protein
VPVRRLDAPAVQGENGLDDLARLALPVRARTKLLKTFEALADTFVFACLIGVGVQLVADASEQYTTDVTGLCMISILAGTLLHQITLTHIQSPYHPEK